MYDAATNSCSFGLSVGQVSDLTTHSSRRSSSSASGHHHHHCGGQPLTLPTAPCPPSVQVKIEECLSGTAAEDWAAGCAYRFAAHAGAARRCYMASEDNAKNGGPCTAASTGDVAGSNKVLDPGGAGGFNSALAASFRNRYLGASAFSNLPGTPALFPGSYVTSSDMNKQTLSNEASSVLNSNSHPPHHQNQSGNLSVDGQEVAPRSPPVNSSSSSTSSNRSSHPVDSSSNKGKGDRRVVVPADPVLWNPDHVKQWLEWAVKEYNLHEVDAARFNVIGRELCQLTREDFSRLTNPYNGEVLYAHLNFLRQTSEASLPPASREKPPVSAQTGSPQIST
ncbi:retroviral integration site protein Fli-1 homolog, partial [Stegodyphus dumicola]|uniref:retroviral integration site protein Fli-1 homolog n=1 Tax=Stegodyphus dumicola TaxID=202533 RepID=UPI0015AD7ECD